MKPIHKIHKTAIIYALKHHGTKTAAARWLGISLRTFRNWEVSLGVRAPGPQRKPKRTGGANHGT